MRYFFAIEETSTGYSAFSPDIPGCAATGNTLEEVESHMKEAVEFHLEGLREEGLEVPAPVSRPGYVEVSA